MSDTPTILVTGARGQLGCELAAALALHGHVVALDRAALDLADADALRAALRLHAPALIVNAAAYTAVDRAQSDAARAALINTEAPRIMAEHARSHDAVLIHYSTDYVFDGNARVPYDEDAPTGPQSVYGATKLAGEEAVRASGAAALILRTSWVYGLRGSNFLLTMRRLAAERDELRVVADQLGVPNWCRELARSTARLVARGVPYLAQHGGLYHMSAGGVASWYEFACAIVGAVPRPRVLPITTADYPTPARRPAYAVLSTVRFERTFGFALPHWRASLAECVNSPAEPPVPDAVGRAPNARPDR